MWFTLATAGLGLMNAFGQRDKAEAQAAVQKSQIEWSNHVGRLETAAKNREVAKANALQWAMNNEITAVAYQQEAEDKVYHRAMVDNEIGAYSRNSKLSNDQLLLALTQRNMKGGSAKAIFNSAQLTQDRIMQDQAVSFSNMGRDITRKRDETLSARNFNYNGYSTFMPTDSSHIDPSAAGDQAFMSGLLAAGVQTLGMGLQEHQMGQMADFRSEQEAWMQGSTTNMANLIALLGGQQ